MGTADPPRDYKGKKSKNLVHRGETVEKLIGVEQYNLICMQHNNTENHFAIPDQVSGQDHQASLPLPSPTRSSKPSLFSCFCLC